MLDHLEAWVGHSCRKLFISQLGLAVSIRSVSPGEDGRDDNERLLLRLVLMQGLSQDLDDFLGLVQVCPAQQVNDDAISGEQRLAKGFWLALAVEELDLLVGGRNDVSVALDHRTAELVRLLARPQRCMVVTHHLEQGVADQTVDTRDEDSLALFDLWHGNLWRDHLSRFDFLSCPRNILGGDTKASVATGRGTPLSIRGALLWYLHI